MNRIVSGLVLASLLAAAPCSAFTFWKKKSETPLSAPAPSQKVEVFVTGWCPFCRRLESFLKEKGIPYTRYDVEDGAQGSALFAEIGAEGVPVTRIGNRVVRGFDPEGVLRALESDG